MTEDFKTIQSLGKAGLIKHLNEFETFTNQETISGIGDDAAVIREQDGSLTLLTTDTFVEGVHFDITYTPFHHLGYKVISTAISDILAMNGKPASVLVSLALPNRQSVQMVRELYKGIYAAGHEYEVEVVGGDVAPNHNHIVITVTAYGKGKADKITYRKGGKPGDALCVTGDLGGALAGLRILMREKKFWEEHQNENIQPDLSEYEFVVKRQLVPKARQDLLKALEQQNLVPGSMIDLSQGLLNEVSEIAKASGTGAYLYQAALPIAIETRHVADEMEEDVDRYALFGGEDLELLFTLSEKEVEQFVEHFNDFTVIGRLVDAGEGMNMQTAEGDVIAFDDLS